ncbi:PLP-dependent transferase [Rhizobium beringeri]
MATLGTYCTILFRRLGIEARSADPNDPSSFEAQIDDRTLGLFGECVSNPSLVPLPIRELAEIGRRHGIPLIVDNTTTPLVCSPARLGAAFSTYSATKYICGHGTTLWRIDRRSWQFRFRRIS